MRVSLIERNGDCLLAIPSEFARVLDGHETVELEVCDGALWITPVARPEHVPADAAPKTPLSNAG